MSKYSNVGLFTLSSGYWQVLSMLPILTTKLFRDAIWKINYKFLGIQEKLEFKLRSKKDCAYNLVRDYYIRFIIFNYRRSIEIVCFVLTSYASLNQ
jgi:hypothetical protein